MFLSIRTGYYPISVQCSHLIPPENTRKWEHWLEMGYVLRMKNMDQSLSENEHFLHSFSNFKDMKRKLI